MAANRPEHVAQGVEDDVLATAHGLASALHRVGAMSEPGMRDMDRLCLPHSPTTRALTYGGSGPRHASVNPCSIGFWMWTSPPSRNGNVAPSGRPVRRYGCWKCSIPTSPIVPVRRGMTQSVA